MTLVKICGITNRADMEAVLDVGADYVGIVREPSSPRYVENPSELIALAAGRAAVIGVYGPFRDNGYVQLFDSIQTISPVPLPNLLRVVRLGEPGVENPVVQNAFAAVVHFFDEFLINGLIVGGASRIAEGFGGLFRRVQSGNLQGYAFVFGIGVILVIYFTAF